jgi:hypothetical protein
MITAGTMPHHDAVTPGLELAQLVGGTDKDGVHGADAAANLVGRLELHEEVPDVDAHHVAGPHHHEGRQAERKAGRQAEDDRRDAERSDAAEHPAADVTPDRPHRHDGSEQRRADGGSGTHDAEANRSDVQYLAGVDRQERRGAAEQHGE